MQSYPSLTKDYPEDIDYSTGSVGLGAAITTFSALLQVRKWHKVVLFVADVIAYEDFFGGFSSCSMFSLQFSRSALCLSSCSAFQQVCRPCVEQSRACSGFCLSGFPFAPRYQRAWASCFLFGLVCVGSTALYKEPRPSLVGAVPILCVHTNTHTTAAPMLSFPNQPAWLLRAGAGDRANHIMCTGLPQLQGAQVAVGKGLEPRRPHDRSCRGRRAGRGQRLRGSDGEVSVCVRGMARACFVIWLEWDFCFRSRDVIGRRRDVRRMRATSMRL